MFIYRKKTKTLQKRINRLRINDFDSLLETSAAWQSSSVDEVTQQASKRALYLQSTRALNEILQDKFVERKCSRGDANNLCDSVPFAAPSVAPEIHPESSALDVIEDVAAENRNNTNKKRRVDFDPHCMLLGDVRPILTCH